MLSSLWKFYGTTVYVDAHKQVSTTIVVICSNEAVWLNDGIQDSCAMHGLLEGAGLWFPENRYRYFFRLCPGE